MFSVLFGALPVFFNFLNALTFEPPLTMGYLFGRGELLLVSAGLSGAALGDLLLVKSRWEKFKVTVTGLSGVNIAAASYYFAAVSGQYSEGDPVRQGTVAVVSLVMYTFALVCSGSCVALAQRGEQDVRGD